MYTCKSVHEKKLPHKHMNTDFWEATLPKPFTDSIRAEFALSKEARLQRMRSQSWDFNSIAPL